MEKYRTAEERREALRRAANREAMDRYLAKKRGDAVPNTPQGIARWWKQRERSRA